MMLLRLISDSSSICTQFPWPFVHFTQVTLHFYTEMKYDTDISILTFQNNLRTFIFQLYSCYYFFKYNKSLKDPVRGAGSAQVQIRSYRNRQSWNLARKVRNAFPMCKALTSSILPSDGILIIERDTKVKISLKSEVAENCSRLKTPAVTFFFYIINLDHFEICNIDKIHSRSDSVQCNTDILKLPPYIYITIL